jgi:periplasmic protein TonB
MPYQGQYVVSRRNPAGIALVVGLHVIFISALMAGLGTHPAAAPYPTMQGEVLTPLVKPVDEVPVDTTPRLAWIGPPPLVDPHVTVKTESEEVIPDPLPQLDPGPGSATGPAHEPVLTAQGIDFRHPLSQPSYPPSAIRAGSEGKLALQILVGTDGRVRDARVLETSGFTLLDQAAVDEARRHWKLRPGTRDGTPVEQWYTLKVVFHLQGR